MFESPTGFVRNDGIIIEIRITQFNMKRGQGRFVISQDIST